MGLYVEPQSMKRTLFEALTLTSQWNAEYAAEGEGHESLEKKKILHLWQDGDIKRGSDTKAVSYAVRDERGKSQRDSQHEGSLQEAV